MTWINRLPAALALLAISLALALAAPLAAADPPNVVLVITDDQGYGDIAAHGNRMIRTPHLDRLWAESVRLTDYHVDPTCSPTRSALMTGRYSTRTGVWHTIMGRSLMSPDELTLAEVFAANGYRTGMFGKWHLGDNSPLRAEDQGFHEVVRHGGGGVGQGPDFWGNDYFDDTYWRNGQPEKFTGYCTDVWFDEALRFIERHRERPFFVYLATNAPHSPYNVAPEYSEPYAERGVPRPMDAFYGMITNIDENVGRVRERLAQLGLAHNTILIFTTDNGTAAGHARPRPRPAARGRSSRPDRSRSRPDFGPDQPSRTAPAATGNSEWPGFNAGMRGNKGSEYDGGHRVPFFIHWPAAHLTGGRDVDLLSAHIDVLPTLVDLCNLDKPDGPPLDGTSLVRTLTVAAGGPPAAPAALDAPPPRRTGSQPVREPAASERTSADAPSQPAPKNDARTESPSHGSGSERTLFVHSQRIQHPEKWRKSAVMTERWRFVNGEELFDIQADPAQSRDLAREHPEVVRRLRQAYEHWWTSLQPVFDDYVRIGLGSDRENPVRLMSHDWHTADIRDCVWNQSQVEQGVPGNGPWHVNVERPGRYEIKLYRWPEHLARPMNCTSARLRIGAAEKTQPLTPDAASATFDLTLPAGPATLQTWLTRQDGTTHGAYFVTVRRREQ